MQLSPVDQPRPTLAEEVTQAASANDETVWNANAFFAGDDESHNQATNGTAPVDMVTNELGGASTASASEQRTSAESTANGPKLDASGENLKSTSEALVRKLLQLDSPKLDPKIVDVLVLEGIMEIVMSHVTRVKRTDSDNNGLSPHTTFMKMTQEERITATLRERDYSDALATKRSYHAMEILVTDNVPNLKILSEKYTVIVSCLFDCFLPTSNANFNHFSKIFEALLRWDAMMMLDVTILDPSTFAKLSKADDSFDSQDAPLLFSYLMPYMYETSIQSAIVGLLFVSSWRGEVKLRRRAVFEQLNDLNFWERLLEYLSLNDHPEYIAATADLVLRLIEEGSKTEDSDHLFSAFEGDHARNIISTLVQYLKDGTRQQTNAAITILHGLLVKTANPPFRSLMAANSYPDASASSSRLFRISMAVEQLLIPYLELFTKFLVDDKNNSELNRELKFSSYTVRTTFSSIHLLLLDCVYAILKAGEGRGDVLDMVTPPFWSMIVNLFFELKFNNAYHAIFYKILCVVLSSDHTPALKALISKPKLLNKMMDVLEDDKPTGNRGFIILALNHIRLAGQMKAPGEYIPILLISHERWQQFVPTLKKLTLRQTVAVDQWTIKGCKRPTPHYGPSPPNRNLEEGSPSRADPLTSLRLLDDMLMDEKPEFTPEQEIGTDLGSKYAYCLGFDDVSTQQYKSSTHTQDASPPPSPRKISTSRARPNSMLLYDFAQLPEDFSVDDLNSPKDESPPFAINDESEPMEGAATVKKSKSRRKKKKKRKSSSISSMEEVVGQSEGSPMAVDNSEEEV